MRRYLPVIVIARIVCGAQSCPWVGLTHGSGWFGLGRDFSVFGGLVGLGPATELVRWGLRVDLLSCCWGLFKHFFEEIVYE